MNSLTTPKMKQRLAAKVTAAAFLTCALLLPIGCGPKSRLIGIWRLDASKSTVRGKPIGNNPIEGALINSISIEFKKDDTYTLTMLVPTSGTYEVSGSTVTLHPKGIFGFSTNNPSMPAESGTISGDTITVPQPGGDKLVFTKQGS